MPVQLVRPEFDAVVTGLYEAAGVPELWPRALEGLARLTGSRGALVTRPDHAHDGLLFSTSLKDVVAQFFEEGWNTRDLRSERLVGGTRNRFFRDQDITSGEERAALDYYRNFAGPAGVPWFAACGSVELDGSILGVSIQRSARDGEFDGADFERLALVEHHVRAALDFSRRMAMARGAERLEGLDRLGVAAMLLGSSGLVLTRNAQAERLLADKTTICIKGGRVGTMHPSSQRGLQDLIEACSGTSPARRHQTRHPIRIEGSDGAVVLVQAVPVIGAAHDLFGAGRAIITFTQIGASVPEQSASTRDQELLAAAFGLTATEARVAHHLAQGLEVRAIAKALRTSDGSVRFHLKSILPKAGVNRQAAFVALAGAIRRPN